MMTSVQIPGRGKLEPSGKARLLLGLQLPLTLALLAFVPGSWAKLLTLLLCWALTFGASTRLELHHLCLGLGPILH